MATSSRPLPLGRVLLIPSVALLLAGCALVTGDSGDSRLIRHRPLSGYPAALLSGVLVQDGPCLVVRPLSGESIVVVWPPQYSLGRDGDQKAVVDWLGHSRWTVGAFGKIGGGEYPYDAIQEFLLAPIPAECSGRMYYWLAGP